MKQLITLIALTALTTFSAQAGTTATLTLKGVIAPILDISLLSETLATSLPLNQAVSNQKVGSLLEKSNNGAGYKISASSQNAGKLVRTGDASSFVQYQLSYNGGNIALNNSSTQIASNSSRGEFSRDLNISYSKPADYMAAGEYSDIVTFTIAAN